VRACAAAFRAAPGESFAEFGVDGRKAAAVFSGVAGGPLVTGVANMLGVVLLMPLISFPRSDQLSTPDSGSGRYRISGPPVRLVPLKQMKILRESLAKYQATISGQ
jgi:hypothetical protein